MCFGLKDVDVENRGQLAHLDGNPKNNKIQNLAFLCVPCHGLYDADSDQFLAYTADEIRYYQELLHKHLGHDEIHWEITATASPANYQAAKEAVGQAHEILLRNMSQVRLIEIH